MLISSGQTEPVPADLSLADDAEFDKTSDKSVTESNQPPQTPEKAAAKLAPPVEPSEAERQSRSSAPTANVVSRADTATGDPIHNLQQALSVHFNPEQAHTIVEQLQEANAQANQSIFSNKGNTDPSPDPVLDPLVEIPLTTSLSAEDQKAKRGLIYEWIQLGFPLLRTETVWEDDDGKKIEGARRIIRVTVDDRFSKLVPYLHQPSQDLPLLYLYWKRGFNDARTVTENNDDTSTSKSRRAMHKSGTGGRVATKAGPILFLKPELPRSERRSIHECINSQTKRMLGTNTINDCPLPAVDNSIQLNGGVTTTSAVQVFWTKVAARRLSKKRKRNDGTEERNTTLCVVRKRQKEHHVLINTLSRALQCPVLDLGFAGMKDKQAVTFQFCTVRNIEWKRIKQSNAYLRERGIEVVPIGRVKQQLNKGDLIGNRFEILVRNMKRVQVDGKTRKEQFVPLDELHLKRMVERIQSGGFVNYYGEQRVGDAGPTSVVGVRPFDIGRAVLQKDFGKAIDLIITGRIFDGSAENQGEDNDLFRRVWKESGGDPVATSKKLPKSGNVFSKERMILNGLKRCGKDNPQAAYGCIPNSERLFYPNAYQSYVWNMMATERIRQYGTNVVAGDLLLREGSEDIQVALGDPVKEKLEDIVLPLPGYAIEYPRNKIGELYESFLKQEKICFQKDASSEETSIKGAYRSLVAKARNLRYELPSNDGSSLDVKFSFDLTKGSYATMLFRELMLTTAKRDAAA